MRKSFAKKYVNGGAKAGLKRYGKQKMIIYGINKEKKSEKKPWWKWAKKNEAKYKLTTIIDYYHMCW